MSTSLYVGFIPASITCVADAMRVISAISDHEDISINSTCTSIWQYVLYALSNHSYEPFREGLILQIRNELFLFFSFGIFRPPLTQAGYAIQLWRKAWQNPRLVHDVTYRFRELGLAYVYEICPGLVFEIQDAELNISCYSDAAQDIFTELQQLPCVVHIGVMKLLITAHNQAVFTHDYDIVKNIIASPDSIHFVSNIYILL